MARPARFERATLCLEGISGRFALVRIRLEVLGMRGSVVSIATHRYLGNALMTHPGVGPLTALACGGMVVSIHSC